MKISQEQINHIRSSVDIVDIVTRYIPLTKKGKNYFGVCPFHEDGDPSLSVSPEKQIFSCFSCHTAGNVFTFIMEYEHISFIEAVKVVADIIGIPLDIQSSNTKYTKSNHAIYDIYNIGQKLYSNNINTAQGKLAKEYLNKRGIDEKLIKEFEIGLAIKSRDALSKVLVKKEFKEKDLIDSALIVKDDNGFHDFFFDRIMFPLHDVNNKVVGYSGRIYTDIDGPKYINSKEHSLFKKGEFLYNYARSKEECRRKNTVIIMEGFMDVIRAYSVGVKNVIATMGTAFTKQHISLIKRLANNVIVCFDGDKAGNKATLACCNELIDAGIIPKVVRLEENLDPDEYILKFGKNKFMEKIENPMSVMDFKLLFYKQSIDLTSTTDKAKYAKTVLEDLQDIDDDILREITLKKISEETDLDVEFLKSQLKDKPKKQEVITYKPVKTNKYDQAQEALLFYMLKSKEVIKMVNNQVLYFPNQLYRLLQREISYFYEKNGYITIADFLSDLDESLVKTVGYIESLDLKEEYSLAMIEDYIKAIKEKNIEDEYERLQKKLKNETDEEKKAQIAQKILEVLRREEDV